MPATVQDFILILNTFFPAYFPLTQALLIIFTIASLQQVFQYHTNQRTEPRQRNITAWLQAAAQILQAAYVPDNDPYIDDDEAASRFQYVEDICGDLGPVFEMLGLSADEDLLSTLQPKPALILTSARRFCAFCPPQTRFRTLRLPTRPQAVRVLHRDFTWRKGLVLVGHCATCKSDYYPDRITYRGEVGERIQQLEYDATHLRISKHGLWVDRRIARTQENAVREFRAGWANFANWINSTVDEGPTITYRQSKRLFVEHFSRRLLVAHGFSVAFRHHTCKEEVVSLCISIYNVKSVIYAKKMAPLL